MKTSVSRALRTLLLLVWGVVAALPAAAQDPVYAVDISHWTGTIDRDDVNCMYDHGVRHVITGTLNPAVTTNQLQMAIDGGMTVDAYVMLYWNGDITWQVQNALTLIAPYPVQRLWLDAEQPRGSYSRSQIVAKIQEAVNACGSMPCGIYTRKVWWQDNTGDSIAFSHLPIWYAYYQYGATFDDWYGPAAWYEGPFGGWIDPTAKQYNDRPHITCSNPYSDLVVDHNLMYVLDDVPPPPPSTPPAPTGLSPDGASFANGAAVTLSCGAISGAVQYEFEIWYESAGSWYLYYTYAPNSSSQTFWPVYGDTAYKFHVRAHNASGAGPWSDWASFDVGSAAATPPAPTGLSPTDGSTLTTSSVTLSSVPISGATQYEFEIWYQTGGVFDYYYTYSATTSSKTFWPAFADTRYQWKMRARNAYGWGEWSAFSTFDFGNLTTAPPPAPTGLSPDNGQRFEDHGSVTLAANPIPDGSEYEFEIWYENNGSWTYYYRYDTGDNTKTLWPSYEDTAYQWRVRAKNNGGWGAWSDWASFVMGAPAPTLPPAPTGLSPDGGQAISTSWVSLSCGGISGATAYQFWIEYQNGTSWSYYYAYASTTASRTFYPALHGRNYRWKVRAQNAAGWGAWSAWATFHAN